MNVYLRKCEGCGLKAPSFGLPSDGKKKRWCADCAPKAARAGWRRTQAGGSPQMKLEVTDPP